jgi:glycosyltransferase involved in cell wall biosynthesis
VVTVHDLIIYDHPEWFPGGSAGVFWRWILVPRALKRASRLIAVSQATKMQIINRFRIDKELIDVVYEGGTGWEGGSGLSNIMTAHNIRPPFLLYVGTLEPRKNLVRLLEAFAALCARRGAWQLVLAGKYGWKYEPILSAVKQLNLASHVILTGYIKPADKQVLYQKAAGLAYPSLAEGFGLPVLEAMQAGLPVLTSNLSSLPEVAGSAAIMVDPYSVESIKSGLEKLMFDEPLRCRLVNDGRRQATKFSWSIAAKQTLSIYQKLTMSNGQA